MRKPNEFAARFPKTTHAVLEFDNEGDPLKADSYYASYDDGPVSCLVSESARLVATYKLVRVQLLVKRSRVEVFKQRKRRSKK